MFSSRRVVTFVMLAMISGATAAGAEPDGGHPVCLRLGRSVQVLIQEGVTGGWLLEGAVLEECTPGRARLRLVAGRQVGAEGRRFELTVTSTVELVPLKAAERLGKSVTRDFGSILARVRRLISNPAVRNFMDRYRPDRINVESSPESFLVKAEAPWQGVERKVKLVLNDRGRDPVLYYEVPGVDAFCGRRELLRLAEAISDELAGCRAVWVEGRKEPDVPGTENTACLAGDEDCIPDAWRLRAVLEGQGCPPVVSVRVEKFLGRGELERYDSWEDAR